MLPILGTKNLLEMVVKKLVSSRLKHLGNGCSALPSVDVYEIQFIVDPLFETLHAKF